MPGEGPYRALSLDLWFTSFYHLAEDEVRWEEARARVVQEFLLRKDRKPIGAAEAADAVRAVRSRLPTSGYLPVTTDPGAVLEAVARRLGAEVGGPPGVAAEAFSAAGISEYPPRANPEVVALLRRLERLGVPTLLLTNSARRASTWSAYLDRAGGPRFDHVVSSCDLGVAKPDVRIFREAARRLDIPPPKILHVGDRWDLDVVGALGAGFGAALYRGLWSRYPDGMYPSPPEPSTPHPGVRLLDSLDALRDDALWER
jgi:HAD superfamily hydrolase (TIGR01549 family)